jgi:MoaA/NifB/PqqE/SkfB family radical SAM enzyme
MAEFKRVGFMITKQCNAKCKHCMTTSSPEANEEMDLVAALRWLNESNKLEGIEGITITGGEPFIRYNTLVKLIKRITELDKISHVVTNGFWAEDLDIAREKIRQLALVGLKRISLSTDSYHQEWIPLNYIKNACEAASSFGVKVQISATYLQKDDNIQLKEEFNGKVIIHEQPISPIGRALDEISLNLFDERKLSTYVDGEYCEITTPVIGSDGTIYACPCRSLIIRDRDNPLILGNAYETPLSDVLTEARKNFLFLTMGTPRGFGLLIDILKENSLESRLRQTYFDKCDLCCHILCDEEMRTTLINKLNEPREKMIAYLRSVYLGGKDAFDYLPLIFKP